MTYFRWLAAVALVFGASACGNSNSGYRGDYAYSPGAYDYNQQPTYYRTHYANGQPTYDSRQPAYYGYGYQAQPVYYSSPPAYYYGR